MFYVFNSKHNLSDCSSFRCVNVLAQFPNLLQFNNSCLFVHTNSCLYDQKWSYPDQLPLVYQNVAIFLTNQVTNLAIHVSRNCWAFEKLFLCRIVLPTVLSQVTTSSPKPPLRYVPYLRPFSHCRKCWKKVLSFRVRAIISLNFSCYVCGGSDNACNTKEDLGRETVCPGVAEVCSVATGMLRAPCNTTKL